MRMDNEIGLWVKNSQTGAGGNMAYIPVRLENISLISSLTSVLLKKPEPLVFFDRIFQRQFLLFYVTSGSAEKLTGI